MDTSEGKQVWDYSIFVQGVFGRNRKVKRELFNIAKHLDSPLPLDQALALMDAKLVKLKFKGAYSYKLEERTGSVKNEGGFEIYTTNLFGNTKLLKEGTVN